MMRAIRQHEYGGPETLTMGEAERPTAGPGHVLLRVAAAGVNFLDIYNRRGRGNPPLPSIPGNEASGVIERVGPGVTAWKAGDRVCSPRAQASYAEYCLVSEALLIALPTDLSFEMGAAFPLQGMTAHYLLHGFHTVQPGETLLVHAAAGGMGLLLVQMAKRMGARVIGTVSTAEKATRAKQAGADEVILYSERDWVAEVMRLTNDAGADYIIDGVSKTTFPGDLLAAKTRGHITVFGAASGPADPIGPNALQGRSLTVSGGNLGNFISEPAELALRSAYVLKGMREGWLKIQMDRVLSLSEAAEAHRLLEGRLTSGKVVLKV